jgi:hypothetical protein
MTGRSLSSLLVLLGIALGAAGQSVRTQNGSLIFETGGASMTLTAGGSCAVPTSGPTALVSQTDLQSTLATLIQPQVWLLLDISLPSFERIFHHHKRIYMPLLTF